jgi:hypothetical protein
MLTVMLLSLWLQSASAAGSQVPATRDNETLAPQKAEISRCADLFETPDERVTPSLKVSPGAPPLLSFRYFEGRMRQRFSGVDLMLDDAGH